METWARLLFVAMSCAGVLSYPQNDKRANELDGDFSMKQADQLSLFKKLYNFISAPDLCSPQPCKNGGRCSVMGNGGCASGCHDKQKWWWECTCLNGYTGRDCSLGPCDSNPCTNGGQCSNHGNSYYCACPAEADCSSGGYTYKATGKFAETEQSAAELCENTFGPGAVVPEAYSQDTLGKIWELVGDQDKAVWLAGYVQNGKAYWTSGNPFPEHLPWVKWAEDFIGRPDNSGTISSEKKCLGAFGNELFTMNCGWYNVVCAVSKSGPRAPKRDLTSDNIFL